MKIWQKACIIPLAALLWAAGGCVSVDRGSMERFAGLKFDGVPDDQAVEHVVVSNFGYYLFSSLPLVCGNVKGRTVIPFSLFSNEVTLPHMQELLLDEVERRPGLEIIELESFYNASPCFTISLDVRSIFGLLIGYREVQLSAVLVKHPELDCDQLRARSEGEETP